MRTPRPPAPRSVSATLRTAGFAAHREDRDEGYLCEWSGLPGESPVKVGYKTGDKDLHARALRTMTGTLTRKGWSVRVAGFSEVGYLIVRGQGQ